MKVLNINDSTECVVFLERGWGDGGITVNVMVKESDGTYSNYREWFDSKMHQQAQGLYDRMSDIETLADYVKKARLVATTGSPIQEE